MLDSWVFYALVGGVGFLFLLIALVGDDFFDLEELFDFDTDLPWFNFRVFAFGLIGFGLTGIILVELDVPAALILVCGILGFLAAAALSYFLVLKPLLKQQSNSSISRQTYLGRTGTLTLGIRKGDFGEVQFTNVNGAIVREVARTSNNEELPRGASVLIIDIENDHVLVTTNELN